MVYHCACDFSVTPESQFDFGFLTALDLGFGLRGLDFGLGLDNEEYDKRKTMSKIKNTVPVNYDCF